MSQLRIDMQSFLDLNNRDHILCSILELAIEHNRYSLVKLLLDKWGSCNTRIVSLFDIGTPCYL